MIHELLQLSRPLFVLDTETTSLDPQSARIVEIGFQLWTHAGLFKEWRSLIDPGVPIPESATKVHGITDDVMKACTKCGGEKQPEDSALNGYESTAVLCFCDAFHPVPTFGQLAANLASGFKGCDFAGKNCRFDLRVLSAEFARAKVEWNYVGAMIIDADRLEALGEPRSLSHLYEKHLGKKLEGAHGALADVRATTEVITAQLEKYTALPRDLTQLHELQWPGLLDADGKFRMVNGVATVTFGKHKGKPMRDVPIEYFDWLIKSDFAADVKALASAAKLKQFPGEK